MNAEITALQNELTIAKQNNQILELRHELQVTQAQKASKLEDSLFSPQLYEHYQKVAMMMSKSEIVPTSYRGKPADIFIAMEMGYQLGFPIAQSLQDIAVINGRPCLWGDGLLALVLSHPDCEGVNEEPIIDKKTGATTGYRCVVKRKGFEPREQTFTIQDASSAGLLKKAGPWTNYPKRMLQMRARAFALRDVFGDALRGFKVAEEQQDSEVIDGSFTVTHDSKPTQTNKLKQILGIGENNNEVDPRSDSNGTDVNQPDNSGHNSAEDVVADGNSNTDDCLPVSRTQRDRIKELFTQKEFSEERIKKALNYYEVATVDELSYEQAEKFITQMERAQ